MGGAVFICEKGNLQINRNKFSSNPPEIAAELEKRLDIVEVARRSGAWAGQVVMQSWIDCVHTLKLPVADVVIGHRSVSVCHLANITRAVGRPMTWDSVQEQFVRDARANSLLYRPQRKGFELPTDHLKTIAIQG